MSSKLVRSRPPSVSPNSLDYVLQVHWIKESKCIFKLARSQPPGTSSRSDSRMSEHTEVTEVERLTRSIYLADPGVDRHHAFSTSSYHTMIIHTLSFATFGLSPSVHDNVDRRNRLGSSTPVSIISSHAIPTLLEPELLVLMDSVWRLLVLATVPGGNCPEAPSPGLELPNNPTSSALAGLLTRPDIYPRCYR